MSELLSHHQELKRKELLGSWGIRLGKHALKPIDATYEDIVPIPNNPHVFLTRSLHLRSLKAKDSVTLKNVMVILAHAMLFGEKREWRFIGTNKPVVESTSAYNIAAQEIGWPTIDVILACRGNIPIPRLERELEEERARNTIFVRPSVPFIVSPLPKIMPGSSTVDIAGIFKKGEGVLWINAIALEWQGIEAWRRYWKHKSRMETPNWTRNKI